jgi:hypothetical protein
MSIYLHKKSKPTDHTIQARGGFRIITLIILNPVYIIHPVDSLYINQSIVIRIQIILYLITAVG